ncbi:MAG: polysaccharide biosynthesis C-terminal domain-containing protein [Xanthomonadales bacterium]|jgi:O-antigen/teichoic acid export membrane protein|nr:polysaccharide biosynthesis C-terminal domain-containing protein [Xanthomonadales bacterium]MDH4018333.1 polysaccharide biosynthesis C-terminal domain-containing protein [Xanthomonadales bacterium]
MALNLVADLLRYYLVLIIPGILVLALFADQILNLLFGVEYSDSGPVLMLLLTALPFLAVSDSLQLVLKAIPKPKAVLTARIVSTLVLLVIAILSVPRYGALGGAAAVVAGEAAAMVLLFWLVKRTLGAMPWNARCYEAILAGVITALVLVLTQSWPLLFRLPFAAIVYILSAGLMKAVSAHELGSVPHLISAALQNDKLE